MNRKSRTKTARLFVLIIALALAGCGGGEEVVELPTQIATLTTAPTQTLISDGAMIEPGQPVSGVIAPDGTPERWLLDAQAGDVIQIQLTRLDETLNLQVQLIDPNGGLVSQFGTGAGVDSFSLPVELAITGAYVIQASGAGTSGAYALRVLTGADIHEVEEVAESPPTPTPTGFPTPTETTVPPTEVPTPTDVPPTAAPTDTPSPQPPGGRLEPESTRRSEITQPGETHRYTFFGNSGESLSILVNVDPENPGTFNPLVEVQAPNGEISATDDDMLPGVLDALIRDYELPTTGVYTVYVKSADELGIGGYYISLGSGFTLRDVFRGEALKDVPNNQTLETYASRDVWLLPLKAGDVVAVVVEVVDPESGFDVMTELVTPDGAVLQFDDNSGAGNDAVLSQVPIPADGMYLLHVAARNNASVGEYQLWWHNLNEYPTATPVTPTPTLQPTAPPPRDTIQGEVASGGVFTYRILANALQNVNIVVQGQVGFDPVLRVTDPLGNIVIEVDDVDGSQDPRANFTAEPSGIYVIEVFGFEGAAGRFSLSYFVQ